MKYNLKYHLINFIGILFLVFALMYKREVEGFSIDYWIIIIPAYISYIIFDYNSKQIK